MTGYIQVITTTEKKDDARRIARALVEARLGGCVHVIGPVASTYWWRDRIETTEEWLCVIKSSRDRYVALEKAIRDIHPYEVPEIIAVPVARGSRSYLNWLGKTLRARRTKRRTANT